MVKFSKNKEELYEIDGIWPTKIKAMRFSRE